MVNPSARTIAGFARLIEKDWLAMGHQFCLRIHNHEAEDEISPIFVQFLDCVRVLTLQHGASFEFTE